MKRVILANHAQSHDNWDFGPHTDSRSLTAIQRAAWSGLFGFDGAMTNNMHTIENVEHLVELHNESLRSDAYIASGPAYYLSDQELGDTVYLVAAIRHDLYPTRTYKYYTYEEAVEKANMLLKRNKHQV